jgi:hypothetical protein
MDLLIQIIPPLVLGSMLFFSIAIAPKIFTVLPSEEAGNSLDQYFLLITCIMDCNTLY